MYVYATIKNNECQILMLIFVFLFDSFNVICVSHIYTEFFPENTR